MLLNGVQLINPPEDELPEGGFLVCEEHHKRMIELITEFGAAGSLAQSSQEVDALLASGLSDPVLDISRVLFTIAVNAIGSKDLAILRCPVCAFQKFDFLAKIAGLVSIKYRDQPRVIAPGEPKLILSS